MPYLTHLRRGQLLSSSRQLIQQLADDDSAGVMGPAGMTGPAEDEDLAGVTGPAGVMGPAEREDSAAAHSAGGSGPAGQRMPAGTTPAMSQTPDQQRHDSVMASEDGSVIFLSLPRQINQTSLLDFMSMMTLMQRRMDTVMPVPDSQDRPPVKSRVGDRSPSSSRTRDS